MACNCGKNRKSYQVVYANGGTRTFLTKQEATVASAAAPGSTIVEVAR